MSIATHRPVLAPVAMGQRAVERVVVAVSSKGSEAKWPDLDLKCKTAGAQETAGNIFELLEGCFVYIYKYIIYNIYIYVHHGNLRVLPPNATPTQANKQTKNTPIGSGSVRIPMILSEGPGATPEK